MYKQYVYEERGILMQRIIICADRNFPRGDAGSNRILFMAKALQETGWDIFVISIGHNEEKYYDSTLGCFVYEGVKYRNIDISSNKYIRKLQHNLLDGKNTVKMLQNLNVNTNDIILLYSSLYSFSSAVIAFGNSIKCKIACDIVEWHQPFQFKGGKKGFRYKAYNKFFEDLVPKTKNVIVISKCLDQHFSSIGCHTTLIPIYVDTDNREPWKKEIDCNHLNLIYPGNPYKKDDMLSMLQAIEMLKDEDKKYVKFHLTGVDKGLLYSSIAGNEKLLDSLMDRGTVHIHSWLEYDELLKLYQKIDFALLARPINKVTESNFPSKVPELMSKGIPVITNRVGDIVQYLEDGQDAILYDEPTAEACKKAIQRAIGLSNEERIKLSKRAFENAELKFSYHLCSRKMDRFFSEMR